MPVDLSQVVISATKPRGKVARGLVELGIRIAAVTEDEGNVDRYIMSKRLAVERRTGSSVLMGIMDKTLFTSAIYLHERFRLPILMIEGNVNYEYSGFDPQAVRGAMSSMILQYGMHVLHSRDPDESTALIAMIARQEQLGIPEISLIPKRKAIDVPDMQRRLVEMLPGCGMVMARDLLQHFGSVHAVINATAEDLRRVRGVGARKAADIVKVTSEEYAAVDTERNIEDAVEFDRSLLFDADVKLLARQHHIYTEEKERHVVDLVFLDGAADTLVLVELKRGALGRADVEQLGRYLDHAAKSRLLRAYLDDGAALAGVLATIGECSVDPKRSDISTRQIDEVRVIDILRRIREARQA